MQDQNRFAIAVMYLAVGMLFGAAGASVAWKVAWNALANDVAKDVVTASNDELAQDIFLNNYGYECTIILARKGLIERDPVSMETTSLLTGAFRVARYWKEDPIKEGRIPYDHHRQNVMKVFGLDDPSDFSRLESINQASVFVDFEDNIIEDRVQLVVEFLSEGGAN